MSGCEMRRGITRALTVALIYTIALLLARPRLHAQVVSPPAPPAIRASGVPIVNADFVLPLRATDWASYRPEACLAAVRRTIDSLEFAVEQDTVRKNLFRAVPLTAISVGRACLQRIDVPSAPDVVLPTLLQLGALVNDTALVRTVTRRQLAAARGGNVHDRATILKTAVLTLQAEYRTPEKSALARSFLHAADTLGGEVAVERLTMYEAVEAPQGAFDPAAYLHYVQQRLAIVQQALPDVQQQFAERGGELEGDRYGIAMYTWLMSGREDDFQHYLDAYRSFMVLPNPLMGRSAPAVTGAFWFNTGGTTPVVPVPGKVNLVVFIDQGDMGDLTQSQLRRRLWDLQHDFPDLQITLVAKTTGAFQGRLLVGHPDQESALIHAFVTDSLRIPGWLCVDSGSYQRLPTDAIVQLPTATMKRYDGGAENSVLKQQFLIDRQGRVVQIGLDEREVDEYLIRLLQHGTLERSITFPK